MSSLWSPDAAAALRVETRGLTEAEVAAATVVVAAAIGEEVRAEALREESELHSRWVRSGTPRQPLPRAWRTFG